MGTDQEDEILLVDSIVLKILHMVQWEGSSQQSCPDVNTGSHKNNISGKIRSWMQ